MKERPILFSGPMVRAILDGRKTQTRRVVMPQPTPDARFVGGACIEQPAEKRSISVEAPYVGIASPYGQPGDRLWVKETFIAFGRWETRFSEKKRRDEWHFVDMTLEAGFAYRFDSPDPDARRRAGVTPTWPRRPAIFMPRVASRITLGVTGVRVERLQDITEVDAIAEGIRQHGEKSGWVNECQLSDGKRHFDSSAYGMYRQLWDSLNAASGHGWDINPWVWVIEFNRVP